MLKLLFWFLLLANAGFLLFNSGVLASYQGYLPGKSADKREPPLNADKLKLLPSQSAASGARSANGANAAGAASASNPAANGANGANAAGAASAPAAASAATAGNGAQATTTTSAAGTTTATTAASAPLAAAEKKPAAPVCIEVGNFPEADARRFEAQLAPLALGPRLSKRTVGETITHMVFIPTQGNKELAEKKLGELKRLGVSDFFLIQEDPKLRYAISLGIFKSEDAAKNRLTELNKQGVRSAKIGERKGPGKTAFQLRELESAELEKLGKIKSGFAQAEQRECAAAPAPAPVAAGAAVTARAPTRPVAANNPDKNKPAPASGPE